MQKGLTKNDLQDLKSALIMVYDVVVRRESSSKLIKELDAKKYELIDKIEYEMKHRGV